MNERLMEDARLEPGVFRWHGAIPPDILREWITAQKLLVPDELFDLWVRTGGGEMFESEVLLRPVAGLEDQDSLVSRNEWYHSKGMPERFVLFEEGLNMSAISQPDGAIAVLDDSDFQVEQELATLEEWYWRIMRSDFASRYDLPFAVIRPTDYTIIDPYKSRPDDGGGT